MNRNILVIAGTLAFFLSDAVFAQHDGTEHEQRACASSVKQYCRAVLDQGDFAVLGCLQQHREKLTAACRKVLADHGQ